MGSGARTAGAPAWMSFPEPKALVGTLTLMLPPGVFCPSRECVSPGTSHRTVGRRGRIDGPGVRTELGSAGLKGGGIWEPGWETPGHLPLQMGLSQRRRELPLIFTTAGSFATGSRCCRNQAPGLRQGLGDGPHRPG